MGKKHPSMFIYVMEKGRKQYIIPKKEQCEPVRSKIGVMPEQCWVSLYIVILQNVV